MDIIIIEGDQLRDLIANVSRRGVDMLRVSVDAEGAKFKVNAGIWSPPIGFRQGE